MRGLNTGQNVVIALFLNNMFLNCTLQDFSYLSKHFCPCILESICDGHISKQYNSNPQTMFFISLQPNFLRIAAKNIKKL